MGNVLSKMKEKYVTWEEAESSDPSVIRIGSFLNNGFSDVDAFLSEVYPTFADVVQTSLEKMGRCAIQGQLYVTISEDGSPEVWTERTKLRVVSEETKMSAWFKKHFHDRLCEELEALKPTFAIEKIHHLLVTITKY